MWDAGYQVVLVDIPVKQQAGAESYIRPGGTTMWGNEARIRNERENKKLSAYSSSGTHAHQSRSFGS